MMSADVNRVYITLDWIDYLQDRAHAYPFIRVCPADILNFPGSV